MASASCCDLRLVGVDICSDVPFDTSSSFSSYSVFVFADYKELNTSLIKYSSILETGKDVCSGIHTSDLLKHNTFINDDKCTLHSLMHEWQLVCCRQMMLTDVCGQCEYSIFMGTVLSTELYMRYSHVHIRVDNQIHHGIGENEKKHKDSILAHIMTTARCIQWLHLTNMCTEMDEQRMCVE